MQKTDSLHQLIQSLNSTEKRLFKIYVKKHANGKDQAYLDLFDSIGKLEAYSEAALLKKLPKSYKTKNIAQNKKYLKDLILKCMREIDENRAEDTVNELMREHVFLGKKNMFKEQWKRLQKAKDLAQKYELYSRLLEILDAEMSYLIEHDFNQSLEFTTVYKAEKDSALKKIRLYNELMYVKNYIFQLLRRYKKNIKADKLKVADDLLATINAEEVLAQNSFSLNMIWYNLNSNHADLYQKKEQVANYRYEMVQLCQAYPWMIAGNVKRYLITYFNYISALFSLGQFEKMKEELDVLTKLDLKSENDKGEYFQNITLYKILYWLNTGKLNDAESENLQIANGLKSYKDKINASSLISIYFNYSLVFFCNENYEECIHWLDKVETVKNDVRADLKTFSKVLKIVCHSQLENNLLIESLVRSVRRQTTLHEAYKLILSAAMSLSKSNKSEHLDLITSLQKSLNELPNFVGKDLIELWMKSQIVKDKSIKDLYMDSIA